MQGRKPLGYVVEVNIASPVLVPVKEVTWAAGYFNHDKDEFYVKIVAYG